ncbi:uncharacterized protein LOC144425641 [Styela clava]
MEDRTVHVTGFPSSANKVKLKLFVENNIGPDIIEDVEKKGGVVVFTFKDTYGLQRFYNAGLSDYTFGNESYKLTVIQQLTEQYPRYDTGRRYQQMNQIYGTRDDGYRNERTNQLYRQNPRFDGDDWRGNGFRKERANQPYRQNPSFEGGDARYDADIPPAFRSHFKRFRPLDHSFFGQNNSHSGFHGYMTHESHNYACRARHAGSMSNLNIQWADDEVTQPNPNSSEPVSGPQRSSATSDHPWPMGKAPYKPDFQPPNQPNRPLNKGPQPFVLDSIQEELFKDIHYWTTLKKMPDTEGSVCVLAQNIDPSKHIETVKMHFENKRRSNNGPVKNIIRMIDGLLIVFKKKEDCESCLEKEEQKFDGRDISVFPKSIPSYFDQTFIIEGVGEATTQDTLTMYLETRSTNEASPISCKKQDIPGVYLVEYRDDFDISERDLFLEKVSKKPLEDQTLTASRLLRTDCLKASGIPDSVTNDTIRLTFESKKRTDGGPVTRIDRFENKITLVYFASYIDTARVCERFKKPCFESIIIGHHPVEVELYFHSLSNLHKSAEKSENAKSSQKYDKKAPLKLTPRSHKNGTLNTYIYKPECQVKVFVYIRQTKTQVDKMRNIFKDLANVELCFSAKEGKSVKFVPEKVFSDFIFFIFKIFKVLYN